MPESQHLPRTGAWVEAEKWPRGICCEEPGHAGPGRTPAAGPISATWGHTEPQPQGQSVPRGATQNPSRRATQGHSGATRGHIEPQSQGHAGLHGDTQNPSCRADHELLLLPLCEGPASTLDPGYTAWQLRK